MIRKLTTAWTTVYVAIVTSITMVSIGLKKLKTNKELILTNPVTTLSKWWRSGEELNTHFRISLYK
jgi:hypothetical protein